MVEIVWKGKYDDAGRKVPPTRIQLPLQTIETVNESTQDRQKRLERFISGREDPEWRNRLIWGDKKYVLPSLLPEFAGKVNLIYIDPPFDTGADFSFIAGIPVDPDAPEDNYLSFTKQPSVIEQKAYRDTWGRGLDSYLQWFYETVVLLRELLTEDGGIYVHLDWHLGHYAKAVLDDVFGPECFRNEIIREKTNPKNYTKWGYGNIHDTIFFYSKSSSIKWVKPYSTRDEQKVAVDFPLVDSSGRGYKTAPLHAAGVRHGETGRAWRGLMPPKGRHWAYVHKDLDKLDEEGRIEWSSTGNPREILYANESSGVFLQDIWLGVKDPKEVYPTAKNPKILERIIRASSNEGDLVLDCFVGSGTTAVVAEKLKRRWIVCDLSRFAVHMTRKRLLGTPGVKPFIVQNLGKYERQAWQAAEFGNEMGQRIRSYTNFILKLYAAQPLNGYVWLHGKKGNRLLHVGSVDSPISPLDVGQIVAEFKRTVGGGKDAPKTNGVDILGWDFAFELNELAKQQAEQANVDVRFLRIPREVLDRKAVEQGDIHFFELASLDVGLKRTGMKTTVSIRDFVIPQDDVPTEVQKQITHWSQWIDYWAVDWNNKNDTFHNEVQEYRTRENPKLTTEISKEYDDPGDYRILVKIIDILGNDTTKMLHVKV